MATTSGGTNLLDSLGILERFGIAQGMHVGDFGCGGAGHFVFPAARLVGDTGLVYAVDILEPVLSSIDAKAKSEGFTNIKTVRSNIETVGATNIPEKILDALLIINLLFQNTKFADILREGSRLMKPNTKLLVIEWKPSGGTVFA
ncbi:methyltransferase domain-containing protein, partial [Candidatus Uhrbacteria bacterium]|nr:methyltransferase domain-containing protein [Candidatus Uhrbacteria bacterium]